MKTRTLFFSLGLVVVISLLGCGSKDQSETTQGYQYGKSPVDDTAVRMGRSFDSQMGMPAGPEAITVAGNAQAQLASLPVARAASSSVRPRMVIKTADLRCEVADYDKTFAEVQRLTEQAGGYIVASTVQNEDEGARAGTVILRVPSEKFDSTLQALKALAASVETESIRGNDVTEEFYDLSARLDNKRKAEHRFQEILKSARTSKDILEVERALSDIREEIERLEGRKRFLADQTDLSTISMSMHEPRPLITAQTQKFGTRLKLALGEGLERGITRIVAVLAGMLAFLIGVVPFLALVVLLVWLGRKYYRKTRPAEAAADQKKSAP